MNKKYIVGILGIVVLFSAIFVYYKNNKSTKIPPEELVSAALGDKTTSGSIYRNEKFGFELNPKNLTRIEEKDAEVWFSEPSQCNTISCPEGIVLINTIDPKYSSLESIRKREEFVTWGSDITISGEPAIRGVSNEASGQPFAIVLHNGKEYRLAWYAVTDQEILASFKFIK